MRDIGCAGYWLCGMYFDIVNNALKMAICYGGPIDEKFKCGKSSVFLHFTAIFTVFKYLANDSRPLILCGICPILGGIN